MIARRAQRRWFWLLIVLPGVAIALAISCAAPAASRSQPESVAAAGDFSPRAAVPEALSPLSEARRDLERLVVRGDLPIDALTFQPVDRAEVAAWLLARRAWLHQIDKDREEILLAGVSYRRLKKQLIWDTSSCFEDQSTASNNVPSENYQLYGDSNSRLLIAPFLRLRPVIDNGEYEWTEASRAGLRGKLYLGRSVVISSGLFVAEIADARDFSDPLIAGTDLIIYETEATLSARMGPVRLRLGRDRHQWGPGTTGGLLISNAAAPFNFMEYQLRLGAEFRFLALTGVTSLHQQRYLALHRLSWSPRPGLSFGFSEGARYQANGLHPLYLSGIVPYTLVERFDLQDNLTDPDRERSRNNVLWSIDAAYRFHPVGLIYAELLADDIATETSDMPTRGGFQTGLTFAPRWRGWDWTLGVEYTRVSNFTYSVYYQDLCLCNWEHQDQPLGYPYGPDAEVGLARLAVSPDPSWTGRLWLKTVRKGGGAIGSAWYPGDTDCEPCDLYSGETDAWKFDGKPYREFTAGWAVDYDPWISLRTSLWLEAIWHQAGAEVVNSRPSPFTRLGFSVGWGGY